ncbi:response regulator [Aerococcus viridans]|uniref:response regulator n=1 Tax=Aerococcus viridans TaxID=1377 RepID=UPI0002E31E9D|nr:response regulator transcription factor [Aerococcus viridans]
MKILLVDDDLLVTSGIEIILKGKAADLGYDLDIVGIASHGEEAVDLYQQFHPDIVLMDIRMPVMTGIEAGKEILAKDPDARIIYLTTFLQDEYIIDALKYGAKGYLLKTDYESLIPAIEAVMKGQRVFGDEIVAKIPSYLEQDKTVKKANPLVAQLSEKERDLIYWVVQGLNNKEIAQEMHFSEGTIRNYLSEILDKLAIRDRTQLAIYYFKNIEGLD